ncbi:MAG TPA: DNA repair protein RecN [Blastocatellia bacterium]|nr:DNA repair protein RecN [Blastocatellia bacterium]
MLTLLNISNIALVSDLQVEFEGGLNLLTGETGSGKSIIVDALGVLIGGRFTSDLIKSGEARAFIEGLFNAGPNPDMKELLAGAGIELPSADENEIIIRRELSSTGRNKVFVNHQLASQSLLRDLRPFLVDIHGQGDQQTLFDPDRHMEILDHFARLTAALEETGARFDRWSALKRECEELGRDQAEMLQLIDTLKFQIDELRRAGFEAGEDERLEAERRRLTNVEKLTALCTESFALIYDDTDSAAARIGQATRRVEELAEYDFAFRPYVEHLQSSRAVIEDLAFALRAFGDKLEFSPGRLDEIENRLVEIGRLKRKYGGTIEAALEHLAHSEERLGKIERSDEREKELQAEMAAARAAYVETARRLHDERVRAAKKLERAVVRELAEVALEHARLEVRIEAPSEQELKSAVASASFTARGFDRVEFYFSANPGEAVRPLARVASGGEASRLMLVLKTIAQPTQFPRTIVFDEIDSGIGGRVSEAVGAKLKKLSETNQVFCVTHQPQIARFADAHLLVEKKVVGGRTRVVAERLDRRGRVEELARMLTGAEITETARRHAREMLKS